MDYKLNLILCAGGHLPSGTSDAEFEAFYNAEIKPLISSLDKFPRINMVFHYSGVVLNWIERQHPEFFMLLEDLLSRKQVEFLGGGFYEPAFCLLPLADKIGQIEMLTTYLRKHFGKRPQGCWLPAMAWEQNLVGALSSCGMNYTFLEEKQFSGAGAKPDAAGIYSPCITEDQGKLVTVFPVAKDLGDKLLQGKPLKIVGELLDGLQEKSENNVVVFPGRCGADYENLFSELSTADPRVRFICPSRFYKNLHSLKKYYFPGIWASDINHRQFIANNPEADGLYAKMIYVHTLINNQLRGDKTRKRTALEDLWKAQDSCLFCHGNDSHGLFHSNIRKTAYHFLIEAEKIIREKEKFTPSLSVFDFDLDGEGEYIFQDEKITCCVKSKGAGIFELDYLPCAWNYLDTIALREGYMAGSPFGAPKGERRHAFVDWLAPAKTLPEDAGPAGIKGGRFCGMEEFDVVETDRVRRKAVFTLPPKAGLPWGCIEIAKTWQLKKNNIALDYALKNTSSESLSFVFGTSLDMSFPGEGEGFLRILNLNEGEKENIAINEYSTVKNVKALEFQDMKNEAIITIEASRSFDGCIFHVRSDLSGREEYQSTCVMPLMQVSLEKGKTWKASFNLKISS